MNAGNTSACCLWGEFNANTSTGNKLDTIGAQSRHKGSLETDGRGQEQLSGALCTVHPNDPKSQIHNGVSSF